MSKTIKTTLILTFVLASLQAMASGEFSLETTKLGDQIVGKRSDGQFFAIKCGWTPRVGLSGPYKKYSAAMIFPNSSGDIILEMKSVVGEAERSFFVDLTDEAADAVCKKPYGLYTFKKEKDVIALSSTGPQEVRSAPASVTLPVGKRLTVRTGLVDNVLVDAVIAAVTQDNQFFAIACSRGILNSSADMIYPNSAGKILVKDYNAFRPLTFGPKPPAEKATYMPLSALAMNGICNNPNGMYTLQVMDSEAGPHLELISGESLEASVRVGRDGKVMSGHGF